MITEKVRIGKKHTVRVVTSANQKSVISQQDFEMVGTFTNADDVVAATGMSNEEAASSIWSVLTDAI